MYFLSDNMEDIHSPNFDYKNLSKELHYLSRFFFFADKNSPSNVRNKWFLQNVEFEMFVHAFFFFEIAILNPERGQAYLKWSIEKIQNEIDYLEAMQYSSGLILGNFGRDEEYINAKLDGYINEVCSGSGDYIAFPKFCYTSLIVSPMANTTYEFMHKVYESKEDVDFFEKYKKVVGMFELRARNIEAYAKQKAEYIQILPNPFK